MPIKQEITSSRVPIKIYTDDIEAMALTQLTQVANLPFIHSHVAAMPDVHCGIGATVGSVIPTKGAIIPAAVGVDIGCGMNALRLSVKAHQLPHTLNRVRAEIEKAVPVGFIQHSDANSLTTACQPLQQGLNRIFEKHAQLTKMLKKPQQTWVQQMGSLGGGNHFIGATRSVCIA